MEEDRGLRHIKGSFHPNYNFYIFSHLPLVEFIHADSFGFISAGFEISNFEIRLRQFSMRCKHCKSILKRTCWLCELMGFFFFHVIGVNS